MPGAGVWRGIEVTVEETLEAAASADCVIVTNPNNPDGRQVEPERLVALAERLAARGGLLVVDEAFADVTPGLSVAGGLGEAGAVRAALVRQVLRAGGAAAGLRAWEWGSGAAA